VNAALLAASILANEDSELARKLAEYRLEQAAAVAAMQLPPVK